MDTLDETLVADFGKAEKKLAIAHIIVLVIIALHIVGVCVWATVNLRAPDIHSSALYLFFILNALGCPSTLLTMLSSIFAENTRPVRRQPSQQREKRPRARRSVATTRSTTDTRVDTITPVTGEDSKKSK